VQLINNMCVRACVRAYVRACVHACVCWSVCVSIQKVHCDKTAYWIWMPFGMVSGIGRGMGVLDGGGDCQREGAVLGIFAHWFEWRFYCMFKTEMYSTRA